MATVVDWILDGLIRLAAAFLQVLPIEAALAIGRLFGFLVFFLSKRRQVAYVNLKAAFGTRYQARERKQIVRNNFCHLGQNVVEVLCSPNVGRSWYMDRYIKLNHLDHYEEAIRGEQGVILLTPHFGNWELLQIIPSLL